jgi:2-succinyl-5-enolpyruvyl-6-hydroxy-3-cyclohexene-1-carboxylate synthase
VAEDREALETLNVLSRSGREKGPIAHVTPSEPLRVSEQEVERIARELRSEARGWLVAGPLDPAPELAESLARLAHATGWPLLADPLSQLRSGPHDRSLLIDSADVLLRAGAFVEKHLPRVVLRFGAMPTSKAYRLLLERHPEIKQIVVDPWEWRDPTALVAEFVRADPLELARALGSCVVTFGACARSEFTAAWTRANRSALRTLSQQLEEGVRTSEPSVVQVLSEVLPEGSTLFVASSMPIRDVDLFWRGSGRRVRVESNRGANGIDGTVSCALGSALGSRAPLVLLIGDLALLHDWSGLLSARTEDLDVTVVVLDNRGGGIFEFLPIATTAAREVFERHFATPQDVDLSDALRGFGFRCATPQTVPELHEALAASIGRRGVQFVLVRSERSENVELHQKLFEAVCATLDAAEPV